jgi:radical SAM superfamily enzyme YgiQ (UPF0313 family)
MLDVLMLQLPVPSSPALNTPLAAGYLKAYAEARGLADRARIAILPRAIADRAGDAALVDAIVARAPHVLGLSLYTWNSERTLEVARRARARLPRLVVVAGGPEVQPDNPWVLAHPAVDIAVVGEGEQTFAAILEALTGGPPSERASGRGDDLAVPLGVPLAAIPGVVVRDAAGALHFGPERVALADLAAVPSPYLGGHLELPPDAMQMVEISRWCPYSCGFCLYGRNMGPKLGSRYFGLERVLAEIAWGKERGVRRVHFVEANLNLVPLFWPLMRALAALNADRQITFYAELRGEHLSDEVVAALDAANVRVVEVGLQTANPVALRASYRRTDLAKWAAGARRLYERGIEVLLDVILGLPEDDAAGVAETLDFIRREALGPYDIFTLQVLPGTAVRREAARHGITFQDRPPYFVLGTARLGYAELRHLRRELKLAAGLDPDVVEGAPPPRLDALDAPVAPDHAAAHVALVIPAAELAAQTPEIAALIAAGPSTVLDLYLRCALDPPPPAALRAWREALPYTPGYLDRAAVFAGPTPEPGHRRVSPRIFLVLPWSSQAEPGDYAGVAQVIWRYEHTPGEMLPLGAWRAAGGAGVWLALPEAAPPHERAALLAEARAWAAEHGRLVWAPAR